MPRETRRPRMPNQLPPWLEQWVVPLAGLAGGTSDVATTVVSSATEVLEDLRKSGRCSFGVAVRLSDESDKTVAEMTVDWLIRRPA